MEAKPDENHCCWWYAGPPVLRLSPALAAAWSGLGRRVVLGAYADAARVAAESPVLVEPVQAAAVRAKRKPKAPAASAATLFDAAAA